LKPVAAWARLFDDPILLPGGRELLTLRDAADCTTKLPKAEQVTRSRRAKAEPSRTAPGITDSIQTANEKPGSNAGLIESIIQVSEFPSLNCNCSVVCAVCNTPGILRGLKLVRCRLDQMRLCLRPHRLRQNAIRNQQSVRLVIDPLFLLMRQHSSCNRHGAKKLARNPTEETKGR
jgi:hypothetical protein